MTLHDLAFGHLTLHYSGAAVSTFASFQHFYAEFHVLSTPCGFSSAGIILQISSQDLISCEKQKTKLEQKKPI